VTNLIAVEISWNVVSKFYRKMSSFEDFDSSLPTGTKKSDFDMSSSIGWKF
jgi:hypothetical protein